MEEKINITWFDNENGLLSGNCLACRASSSMHLVCEIPNNFSIKEKLKFVRCQQCGSLNVIDGDLFEYTDAEFTPAIWRHYMHIGAGIDFMVRPIQRAALSGSNPSILDVGCGFGYTLDFFRSAIGDKIAGVEPSPYGRMGRDMLDLPIEISYLSGAKNLMNKRFDIVFSSEVIEHTPDPKSFILELDKYLSQNGTIIITTPNASYVSKDNVLSMVAAVLSPGLHKFIFSRLALENILRDSGFTNILIEEQTERLIAFASRQELCVQKETKNLHKQYVEYLQRSASRPTPHADVEIGFRYRAFKELVNLGRILEARPQAEALIFIIQKLFGFSPLDRNATLKALDRTDSFENYVLNAPYCLGPFLFYHAMMRRVAGDNHHECALAFRLAFEVLDHVVQVAPFYAQEASSLLWRSLLEEACALKDARDIAAAGEGFARILNFTNENSPSLRISHIPEDVLARARMEQSFVQAAREGRSVTPVFIRIINDNPGAALRHVLRRYAPLPVWKAVRSLYRAWQRM